MSPSLRGAAVNAILLLGLLAASHQATAGSIEYIHTDALGTPVAITDADRNVLQRSEYEPYGKLLNRPAQDGPGFTGHVTDQATGLSYMQQRYYDPGIGRFLSVDPVTPDGNGSSFNRYDYASENPYRFTDPDGRHPSELQRREAAGTRGDAGASGIEGYNPLRSNNGAHNETTRLLFNPPTPHDDSGGRAPTTDLESRIHSSSVTDRWIAAKAAMIFFKIQNKSQLKLYVTMMRYGKAGGERKNEQGLVVLYAGAFDSWSYLGSVLGHEYEGHEDNLPNTNYGITKSEVNAWQYNINNAVRFGNTPSEIKQMHRALDFYQSNLDAFEKAGDNE